MQLARRIARWGAAAAAPVLLVGLAAPSFADDIHNDLDGTVDTDVETVALTAGGAGHTTTFAVEQRNGDGKQGCNLNQNIGQTLTVAVTSSNPAVALVTPATLVFTHCGARPSVTVTPLTQGTARVTVAEVTNTTGASFTYDAATFDVNVSPANTAPSVVLAGVTDGSSYAKGGVPSATCEVTDAEDGPSSFAATLSAVTGPNSADGLGSQTATCSYTDAGGLSDDDVATYDVVDSSKPSISYDLTPAAPDGENGWFASNVSVDWTVSDAESPGSLTTSGCDDVSITADQAASTYTCSADSAGGHDEATTEGIKVDTTDPTVDVTGGPVDGAKYYVGLESVPAAPTCTADDATSGVNGDGCVVSGWSDQVGAHTVTATAKDNAGNTTAVTSSYDVVQCNSDTWEIGSVCAPKCNAKIVTIMADGGAPIVGTEGNDVIVGSEGDDVIDGLGGNDIICGLGGADTIDSGDGADTVFGGLEADLMSGGRGNDILLGGAGADDVQGGEGDDTVRGQAGNDSHSGGGGADLLIGAGGFDIFLGGDGDDTLHGGPHADTVHGGAGHDILEGGDGDDTMYGEADNDTLIGNEGNDDLQGGDGEDTLKGHTGNDSHDGGAGADMLMGAEGLDTFMSGDGDDTVYGGADADSVHGSIGHDTLNGGDGPDSMYGEGGDDTLKGGDGDDSLDGGEGDDRLIGGPGTDVLSGGAGINFLFN